MSGHTPGPWAESGWRIQARNYYSDGSAIEPDNRDPGTPPYTVVADIADVLLAKNGSREGTPS